MQTSKTCFGAMRLNFTTKKGNKDYYKGTRQAFVPGTSVRTGLPGRHSGHKGRPRFEIEDTKVRHYVAPPAELYNMDASQTTLKPYVSGKVNVDAYKESLKASGRLPSFSPLPMSKRKAVREAVEETDVNSSTIRREIRDATPTVWKRAGSVKARGIDFTKAYRALPAHEREALIHQARREWWEAYQAKIPKVKEAYERTTGQSLQEAAPTQ